jgi:hypothetical protein
MTQAGAGVLSNAMVPVRSSYHHAVFLATFLVETNSLLVFMELGLLSSPDSVQSRSGHGSEAPVTETQHYNGQVQLQIRGIYYAAAPTPPAATAPTAAEFTAAMSAGIADLKEFVAAKVDTVNQAVQQGFETTERGLVQVGHSTLKPARKRLLHVPYEVVIDARCDDDNDDDGVISLYDRTSYGCR